MFEKQGKFYADWRDRTGKRKRKSFSTSRAALRFEEEQKELARPRLRLVGKPSHKSSSTSPASRSTQPLPQPPASSSRLLAVCTRATSAKPTQSKSIRRSK